MYCPDEFTETRPDALAGLIRDYPLGLLVTAAVQGPTANPVPFQLTADGTGLRAHLARANPQLNDLREGGPVLVVFQGEQAYITPSNYATKAQTGKVVPTWNYLMVQARGRASLTNDADWLRAQIEALTAQMEAGRSVPWGIDDAPERYIDAMMRGIVGVEIAIDDMRGKWKASQNKSQADRAGVAAALAGTHPILAKAAGD